MGRTKGASNLSQKQQKAIVEGHKLGRTHMELAEQFKISRCSVTNLLRRWRNGEMEIKRNIPGRPRITTDHVDRAIVNTSRKNPRLTASDIAKELVPIANKLPSKRTIRRRLQDYGLNGRRPVKKPLINRKNRLHRVMWAKAHLHWTRSDWDKVGYKKKIKCINSDQFYVFRCFGPMKVNSCCSAPTASSGLGAPWELDTIPSISSLP